MMARNWTEGQKDAIKSRKGSVLVSAAAGSGKTAVLVERVIERLTDKENPSSADRLLIVTFTKAAANEMKQRIEKALDDEIKKHPEDKNLINQKMLLPSAQICTIDSFCNKLVRDNFQLLDISPDFKNADDGENSLLKDQAMELTLAELYEEKNEDFISLVELLTSGRDDSNIAKMITNLYESSRSYPFPEKWLDEVYSRFKDYSNVSESAYGKIVLEYVREALSYCLEILGRLKAMYEGCDEYERIFKAANEVDMMGIETMLRYLSDGKWDELKEKIEKFSLARRANTPKNLKDDPDVTIMCLYRDKVKDIFTKKLKGLMCCTKDEYVVDMSYLRPMVLQLVRATKRFGENFATLKKEKNVADFSDIMHMAISLLVVMNEDGTTKRTALAKSISESIDEILIDEYQDTNRAQDMLFSSISRNNFFRVGDVKQSIYRFRKAMPEIFIELKNSYETYEREKENYPSKIILGNNFRSRKNVTGAVNFVFSQVMSESTGGVDYDKDEELVCSADYKEKEDECAELHIIRSETFGEDDDKDTVQAEYVADLINRMIDEGFTVKDGEGERKATYGDFCVLMRATKGRGAVYADALRKKSIPCYTEVSGEFFSSYEISLMLSLLRVIDNPRQDIPLMTVMMSVFFGFTADDMASIRINDRKGDLYSCLLSSGDNEKVKAFTEKISYFRTLCNSMSVEDFIREIYDETSFVSIVSAMKDSRAKIANLSLLAQYAAEYEKAGYIGISGFIGFIDAVSREKHDLKGSNGISPDSDVVKIMSIHKSKGLEFPVCIIVGCGGKFNAEDEKSNMVISSKAGIGLVLRQIDTFAQYPTLSHKAVKLSIHDDSISEEMRILYVAMTRAKEKLIMLSCVKDVQNKLTKYALDITASSNKTAPFVSKLASSYNDWLLRAFLRHKDAKELRHEAGVGEEIVLESDFSLKVKIADVKEKEGENEEKEVCRKSDRDFLEKIKEKLSYRYEYEPLTYAVSKRAASEVDKNSVDRDYFAYVGPAFLSKDGLTAAQRGTATHAFMQYADYEKASLNVEAEIERLREMGFILENEANAINVKAVETFFKGSLAKRILGSELVMREKKFTVSVPISEVYPELEAFSDEKVLLQGIADCAFVENGKLVIVDYKTDNLENEDDFREKYTNQVKVYKKALMLCTGYEVSETMLYSFKLGREISICGE